MRVDYICKLCNKDLNSESIVYFLGNYYLCVNCFNSKEKYKLYYISNEGRSKNVGMIFSKQGVGKDGKSI